MNHFPNSILNDDWISYSLQQRHPESFTHDRRAGAVRHRAVAPTRSMCRTSGRSGRLTLSGAIRYDHTSGFFPAAAGRTRIRSSPSARVIPAQDGTSYHDITPRLGVAYDVFGNGKTALKVNLGKYLAAADGSSITGSLTNPLNRITLSSGSPDLDRCQQQLPRRLRSDAACWRRICARPAATSAASAQRELRPDGR